MASEKKVVGAIPAAYTDCMPGCTSMAHRNAIVAAVTRCHTPDQLIRLLTCICSTGKPWRVKDDTGKSMFHLAAALGKIDILEWYLRSRGFHRRSNHDRSVLVDDVDSESGWSALHRAAFQGEIASVAYLLDQGADTSLRDHDGYTPVQLLIHEQQSIDQALLQADSLPQDCYPVAFYPWGSNSNFTLGFGDDQHKNVPDKLRVTFLDKSADPDNNVCQNCGNKDLKINRHIGKGEFHLKQLESVLEEDAFGDGKWMRRPSSLLTVVPQFHHKLTVLDRPVMDVVLRKYHTIFLTPNGVFVCGHGHGGRLGVNTEKSLLAPTRIDFPTDSKIVSVAAGVDHSVFLDEEGLVYVCGSNQYHQLGLSPPPAKVPLPTVLPNFQSSSWRQPKKYTGAQVHLGVIGIAAERCHTLFWNQTSLYVCGYNGGQLGLKRDAKSSTADLHQTFPKELTEVKGLFPAKFVRCSDAAVLICSSASELPEVVVIHEYEIKRLPKLPRLSRVLRNEPYRVTEICVFGGTLDLPGKEAKLSRDLVVVALAFDMPLLYVDKSKGSWIPIGISGVPRDMSAVCHISLCSDKLLCSTSFGECYEVKLTSADRAKVGKGEYSTVLKAERIPRLWRATKVFSEPGGRNFAAIQMVTPFRYQLQRAGNFDRHCLTSAKSKKGSQGSQERQAPSANPSVLVTYDCISLLTEKLFLQTGSRVFRDLLVHLDERDYPAVLNLNGRVKSLKTLDDALDKLLILADWPSIRSDFYPKAKGIWDVEPDIKFLCDEDGVTINAHISILTSRVLYFENLLEGNRWRDSDKNRIPVLPCDEKTGLKFVEFVYMRTIGEPLRTLEECVGLLKLADFLTYDRLRNLVSTYFKPFLNSDQMWPLFKIADMYNASVLHEDCLQLMVYMLPELVETKHLLDLDQRSVATLRSLYRNDQHFDFSYRGIAPIDIPGVDWETLDLIKLRQFAEDDGVLEQPEPTSSNRKSFSKKPTDASPKSKHLHAKEKEGPKMLDFSLKENVDEEGFSETKSSKKKSIKKNGENNNSLSDKNAPTVNGKTNGVTSPEVSTNVRIEIKSPPVKGQSEKTPPKVSPWSPNTSFRESSDDESSSHSPSPASVPSSPPSFTIHEALTSRNAVPSALSSIMEEQRRSEVFKVDKQPQKLNLRTPPPKSAPRSNKKFTGQNLVEFEREQMAIEKAAEEIRLRELEKQKNDRPKGNPWGKSATAPSAQVVPSLSATMAQEQSQTTSFAKSPSPSTNVSISKSATVGKSGSSPWSIPQPSSSSPPSFNLSTSPGQWPSTSERGLSEAPLNLKDSFQSIQEEEKAQLAELQKSRSRPLNLIQLEEKAIDDLEEFYHARNNPEETIVVERVLRKAATASWYQH